MTKSRTLAAFAAGLALTMPAVALAQEEPPAPDTDVSDQDYEVRTGTRIQHIVVIGAIRDRSAPQRAEQPADRRVPELPVTYEDAPARPSR